MKIKSKLTKAQINWNYRCGIDRRFAIRMRVMQYADLSISAQEYEYFYNLKISISVLQKIFC